MSDELFNAKVEDLMSAPLIVKQDISIQDGVTNLFMYDSGTLYVVDDNDKLIGITSRKDILRFLINGTSTDSTPIALVMTRMPNIVVISPDTTILSAARLLQRHEIDSLPVVESDESLRVVGKVSKTSILNHYIQNSPGGAKI